jgi:hypothetical protein
MRNLSTPALGQRQAYAKPAVHVIPINFLISVSGLSRMILGMKCLVRDPAGIVRIDLKLF